MPFGLKEFTEKEMDQTDKCTNEKWQAVWI